MEFFLMRKNDIVTICELDGTGTMLAFSSKYRNPELAPLGFASCDGHIKRWWKNRQIPVRQGRVEEMLRKKGYDGPSEYLLKNLGLSLTDHYWIRPIESSLKWEDVNLFDNDFKEDLLQPFDPSDIFNDRSLTPNSSMRGELEKSWLIQDGKRVLVKGNHGELSSESINEVIASEFHKAQGYDNYTEYHLVLIKDKPYDYGCFSEAFTSNRLELVSAYDILTSEKKPDGVSDYEFMIEIAGKHGLDSEQFRDDLEYQIVSDYLLTNIDRHMDNIGVLRDSDTLKFVRMAPIFDTGRAFGGRGVVPYTDEEIDDIEVNSFEQKEADLLRLVKNRDVVDLTKCIDPLQIEEHYRRDGKIRPSRVKSIIRLYQIKCKRLENV